jgi:tRNA A37 N6-isopentenylltransferase MiaA
MWNVKTGVIPVIIGGTGTISKSFRKHVSTIPGNHDIREHTAENFDTKVHYSQCSS